MIGEDILYLSVQELGKLLQARKLSPVELTEATLARLERLGPKLGAVATLTRERALEEARSAEREIAAGKSRGPLHGIPYGAKDLLATRAIPTTWGAPPFKNQLFDYDATVVRKLRDAGAILVAKLSMIELAGGGGYNSGHASLQGASRCPFNLDHWAGGSSSGPGAAVPSALVSFAIGSETFGSIITPAAFSGVSGLRPTYGRVSRHGAMALSWTMDKLGPMCRSAIDCGLVLSAIAGEDPRDATSRKEPYYWWPPNDEMRARSLAGKRLGILRPDFPADGDPEVGAGFDEAVRVLRSLGARVEEADLPDFPYGPVATLLYTGEAASIFRPFIVSPRLDELVDETQRAGLRSALELKASDYLDAFRLRTQIAAAMGEIFNSYDALVAPSRTSPAPPLDRNFDAAAREREKTGQPPENRKPAPKTQLIAASNIAGLPALSVPCGFTKEKNLPIGIQFVADALREDVCIECAHAFQLATDWHQRRPALG
jgi:aspartyl-tRNA(Asn)/glutamyl-tRNA(Gln) amidotransferase subunit A